MKTLLRFAFFFLDLRQVRIIVDLRIVPRTHTDNKLDVVVMYELYIYKISVLCCFQCAVRCVFSSELLYISITDKLCQYLFFIFLKFISWKLSAFRSELVNINTAVSACQYVFSFIFRKRPHFEHIFPVYYESDSWFTHSLSPPS